MTDVSKGDKVSVKEIERGTQRARRTAKGKCAWKTDKQQTITNQSDRADARRGRFTKRETLSPGRLADQQVDGRQCGGKRERITHSV
jgi:hypothetical protein